jgi:hypothetical protein
MESDFCITRTSPENRTAISCVQHALHCQLMIAGTANSMHLSAQIWLLGKLNQGIRVVAAPLCARVYHKDIASTAAMVRRYWRPELPSIDSLVLSTDVDGPTPSRGGCAGELSQFHTLSKVNFVYDDPNAEHLKRLRERFALPSLIAGAADEYHAMLTIGGWLGSRWDHGTDAMPGGTARVDAVHAIEQGMQGKKFWCEIAAKVAVQVFSALGWPARLATASRGPFVAEHAVAEVWSNLFCKWFAMDTDFNVIYECKGVPLSAYELCHDAPAMQRDNALQIRLLGRPKPSLPLADLIPLYESVFIDMRSDWNARPLRRGSPCGGDLSSWWTARPGFKKTLRPKLRIDQRTQFDWQVNVPWIRLTHIRLTNDLHRLSATIHVYSPYFAGLQQSTNDGPWQDIGGAGFESNLPSGHHALSVRVRLSNGGFGPVGRIEVHLPAVAEPHVTC